MLSDINGTLRVTVERQPIHRDKQKSVLILYAGEKYRRERDRSLQIAGWTGVNVFLINSNAHLRPLNIVCTVVRI